MTHQVIFAVALVAGAWLLVAFLRRMDAAEDRKFSMEMLLLKPDGSADKPAFVLYCALFIAGMVIVHDTFMGDVSDAEYQAFLLAFVAPSIAAITKDGIAAFSKNPTPQPPVEQVT